VSDRIEQKKQQRLRVLQALYEAVDGSSDSYCYSHEFFDGLKKEGMSFNDADAAFTWLIHEGLAARIASDMIGITHYGVREIEEAHDNPDDGTEHFTPAVIHQVQNFYGTVGGVQTGSHNTQHIAQQFNAPANILQHFATLRAEAQKLPVEKRSEAIELVDAIEEQATAEKPKLARVKSYAEALGPLMEPTIHVIRAIVEWIAAKQ